MNQSVTIMKSNFKLAPMSCHCKLNVLIPHLKSLSAQKSNSGIMHNHLPLSSQSELLFKRYI